LHLHPNGDYAEILRIRADIAEEIEKKPEFILLNDVQMELTLLLADLQNGKISLTGTRNRLKNIRKGATKWDEIKSNGISVLSGTQLAKAEQLINSCKSYGLFIVHKGELEAWMNLQIGKKNKGKWVVRAVDALREGCSQDLASFLGEIFTYLRKPNLRKQEA
jgi:hypothetical protein